MQATLLDGQGMVFETLQLADFPTCIITRELGSTKGPERYRAWIRQTPEAVVYANGTSFFCTYLEAGTTLVVPVVAK